MDFDNITEVVCDFRGVWHVITPLIRRALHVDGKFLVTNQVWNQEFQHRWVE